MNNYMFVVMLICCLYSIFLGYCIGWKVCYKEMKKNKGK